jgi:hypothetical protein
MLLELLLVICAHPLRLVQAGGGSATHECGSGDLLDTGRAHALARRRGERTTSQHFERCVYVRVGEVWEVVVV